MDFLRVRLQAPGERLGELRDFYEGTLGIEGLRVGPAVLEFVAASGEPFYHFAFLAPGDRFEAALAWARKRVELLPGGDVDEVVFDFDNWNALACYFLDPAGNIVELIAHRGIGEEGATGEFRASELLGFSELGLVGDPPAMAAELRELGLELWDGELGEQGRLAFIGERARVLILSPEGRGWLPTDRSAEPWPVEAVLSGISGREILVGGVHRIAAHAAEE
jgi:catechol 2,3-dioxygenase-like lactoylglutathione lyase family enzyme